MNTRRKTSKKLEWPYWLDDRIKDQNPEDDRLHKHWEYYRTLIKLVERFYEAEWPGYWKKLAPKFRVTNLEQICVRKQVFDRQMRACPICKARVSPIYEPHGEIIDPDFSYTFMELPMPKPMPQHSHLGGVFAGKEACDVWSWPHFLICENGHGIVYFSTRNFAAFGKMEFYYMWSPRRKEFITVQMGEIDPVTTRREAPRMCDKVVDSLREEYEKTPREVNSFRKLVDISAFNLSMDELDGVEGIVEHMFSMRSMTNFVIDASFLCVVAPERAEKWRECLGLDDVWSGVIKNARFWRDIGDSYTLERLARAVAILCPERALEFRRLDWFRRRCLRNAKMILRGNPIAGWEWYQWDALALKWYFPDQLEKIKGFKEVMWQKGTQYYIPEVCRFSGDCGYMADLAMLRFIFPERFEEIKPTEEDFLFVLRSTVSQCKKVRKSDAERKAEIAEQKKKGEEGDKGLRFSLNGIIEYAFNYRIVTAKEVSFDPKTLRLHIA